MSEKDLTVLNITDITPPESAGLYFFTLLLYLFVVIKKKEIKMEDLRKRVKMLKALQGITYNELAQYIEIKPKSFYSWLNHQYELGKEKSQ